MSYMQQKLCLLFVSTYIYLIWIFSKCFSIMDNYTNELLNLTNNTILTCSYDNLTTSEFVIHGILSLICIIFGTFANIMNVITFGNHKMRRATINVFFIALSIADFGVLIGSLCMLVIPGWFETYFLYTSTLTFKQPMELRFKSNPLKKNSQCQCFVLVYMVFHTGRRPFRCPLRIERLQIFYW